MADKKEIIKLLSSMANLMEFNGENKFKVSAYRNGANVLRRLEDDLDELIRTKSLGNIKGIGKGLQSVIYEYAETGKSTEYENLLASVPDGIEELFLVRGIGVKKIKVLYDELGITNIGELEYACKENRLKLLPGFGQTTQDKILAEIEKLKIYSKYVLLNHAEKFYNEISGLLSEIKTIRKHEVTGELRRCLEVISSIKIVALCNDVTALKSELKNKIKINGSDDKIIIQADFPVPVYLFPVLSEEEYASRLFETTGSEQFLKKLNYNPERNKGSNEGEIFKSLNVSFIIPEMREEEFFSVKNKKLEENSTLSFEQFKGMLHFHTTNSDGRDTLEKMILKAKELNFEYAAVCDHSKSAFYANGLTEERVLKQKEEIAKVSGKTNFTIFHGIESDILKNGNLDYDDKFLSNFDFIVASVHSIFNLEEKEMTRRIIKAVENPHTNLLGHPTGRLLLSREPYKVDMKKIIEACAANNTAIEINANPRRLDLDWRLIYYAREKGCLFSINPDAHSTEDILYTKYGIMVARKAGLQPEEVINCFDEQAFIKFLNK
ncbi:DNA polymerase/3'-5' exonuclease PolX [bacterium BMS3Abin03]|nr:DNA polymerase/3'-5' exonuclease PolX [bacterium BMS3Abin03]